MSTIKVSNLTFSYDQSYDTIFDNVSLSIDTNWKLGFIGRNGRGKTTFFNLLMGKYDYSGSIATDVKFYYFPSEVEDKKSNTYEIASSMKNDYEKWKLEREVALLDIGLELLNRPFETLSKGEQTKILLAILFLHEDEFFLIDEPTNHLDVETRSVVAKYLKSKNSYILISHDRKFLDDCVDHVLSINRSNIEIQQGNFSTWWENKKKQDIFELNEKEKLQKDITRLEFSAKQTANWANQVEDSKYGADKDHFIDKGYIGHKSAKMMKRSIVAKNRKERAIEEKSKLLKNLEKTEVLKLKSLNYHKNRIIEASNLAISYSNNLVCNCINFVVERGDRLQLKGRNGCGKSSVIKLILGENIEYSGYLYVPKNLKISYVSQDTSFLNGDLRQYAINNQIDETLFKSILRKLGFEKSQFDNKIEKYSEGQKKKVLIARSLCENADLYIWDEPLNYIDILSRIQIEDLIIKSDATMIFVDHDEEFSNKISTKSILINKKTEIKIQ
jgi:lincosamide and streptogramin A transport system ATP-binding/permease protein